MKNWLSRFIKHPGRPGYSKRWYTSVTTDEVPGMTSSQYMMKGLDWLKRDVDSLKADMSSFRTEVKEQFRHQNSMLLTGMGIFTGIFFGITQLTQGKEPKERGPIPHDDIYVTKKNFDAFKKELFERLPEKTTLKK